MDSSLGAECGMQRIGDIGMVGLFAFEAHEMHQTVKTGFKSQCHKLAFNRESFSYYGIDTCDLTRN